jgi:hypothetical protein
MVAQLVRKLGVRAAVHAVHAVLCGGMQAVSMELVDADLCEFWQHKLGVCMLCCVVLCVLWA